MTMTDPLFARDGHFARELDSIEEKLIDVQDTLRGALVCGSGYRLQQWGESPRDSQGEQWYTGVYQYYVGCGNKYSGSFMEVAFDAPYTRTCMRSTSLPTVDCPFLTDFRTSGPNGLPAPDRARVSQAQDYLKSRLNRVMGLAELDQFIDVVGWYANKWAPLYNNRLALGGDSASGIVTASNPTSSADQLWSYDPRLKRLRNGLGLCPQQRAGILTLTNACDWTDPAFTVMLDPVPARAHLSDGQCMDLQVNQGGTSNLQMRGSPCDGRRTVNRASGAC
jgi:hypothetical protein